MSNGDLSNRYSKSVHGFPTPKFLCTPAVGVNISDHSIKILELIPKKDYMILGRHENIKVPDGIISSGIVKNEEDFVNILRKAKKDLDLHFIRASVPEENAYSFNITLPNLSEKELYDTIKFQLSEHVPLTQEEAIFDYDIVGICGENTDISVSVLPKKVVNQYVNFFKQAELIPIALEIEAQAMARSVVKNDDKETTMIVDIGRTRTGVSIVSGHVVQYTATLDMGGDSFISAIQKAKDITFEEADILKQKHGFIKGENSEFYEILVNSLAALKDELLRRFDYWTTHISKNKTEGKEIQKVVLVGGNATMPGLREQLESALSVPVKIGNVWVNTGSFDKYIPEIDFNHSLGFASAIGLALSKET